jgi:UDP-GlcNAc3NAcA epimerase
VSGASGPVVVCFGTRPQVIKASALLAPLRALAPTLAVDTGQHYDYELNALQYKQLGIARPDQCLEVGSGSHATQTAAILTGIEPLLQQWRPQVVVVIGDTNSTLGCALAAAKLRIPVVHVEAGLRASDTMLAEDINRRAVDALSTVLCAPSARVADRLNSERLPGRTVITGDLARDVLLRHLPVIPTARVALPDLAAAGGSFAYATLHRAELTNEPEQLGRVLEALGRLGMPVILPMHPRTMKVVNESGLRSSIPSTVHLTPPLGYFESVACVRDARVVVTDSGGVQREAYWLGTPCVTLRTETEWEETIECGANVIVPPDDVDRLPDVTGTHAARPRDWNRDLLGTGHAAELVAASVGSLILQYGIAR